jgi:large subunit ribosomal protein L23
MILIKPNITEKSMISAGINQYTFKVNVKANKHQIKKAVEDQFGVNVLKINTTKTKQSSQKSFRTGKTVTKKAIKKAIVTLKKGQTIPLFDIKKK